MYQNTRNVAKPPKERNHWEPKLHSPILYFFCQASASLLSFNNDFSPDSSINIAETSHIGSLLFINLQCKYQQRLNQSDFKFQDPGKGNGLSEFGS